MLAKLDIGTAINYTEEDFERELQDLTDGKGVDVVLETVGGGVYRKSVRLLKPFGRIVVAGFASFDLNKFNPVSWVRTWRDIPRARVSLMARNSCGVMAFHVIGHTFEFTDMEKAHEPMESRQSVGKIIVRV